MTQTSEAIWAVSDGRSGILNQVRWLAEAVARRSPRAIEIKRAELAWPWRIMPTAWFKGPAFGLPFSLAGRDADAFSAPWPRVLISCGRRSAVFSAAVRRLSGRETFTVHIQDPRLPLNEFDLIVPPLHDALEGANVFPVLGSISHITPVALYAAAERWRAHFASLPFPRVAVLIGGTTSRARFTLAQTDRLADTLIALMKSGAGLMVTTSRRTGEANTQRLKERLAGSPAIVWTREGDNPYMGMLALADFIMATEDSVNMAAEAAATGKPVYTLAMPGTEGKIDRFHNAMRARGIARRFEGRLEPFSYEPLAEAERAAHEICRRASLPIVNHR